MEKISIILTSYNCSDTIQKTLKSIEIQDYPNIQIIIKDGESTDETINIIKRFAKDTKREVIWVSNKDFGLYDAMNQGYKLSTGDIIVFFNDVFANNRVVSDMITLMEKNSECEGVHGDLVYVRNNEIIRKWQVGEGNINEGWMPAHPTLFLKRKIYETYGLYNISYKCAADYEFMVRILKDNKVCLAYMPKIIVEMFYGGTSTAGIKGYWISFKEGNYALKQNGIKGYLWITFKRSIRTLLQFRNRGDKNENCS